MIPPQKRRFSWRTIRSAVAVLFGSLFAACRWTKTVQGRVTDYDTRAPLPGVPVFAYQYGWGTSPGYIVWDDEYRYRAETGQAGDFVLRYRVGYIASLNVNLEGYNRFHDYAKPGERVEFRLKRLPPPHARLQEGQIRFGLRDDGTLYGWAFDRKTIATSCADADILPSRVDAETQGPILINACGQGGLRFIPAESLGVRRDFLVYADTAPEDGYTRQLLLDFTGRGGIVFVRTRDGQHYAKFEFTTYSFGGYMDRGVKRDVAFGYVFDPSGSRYLPYEILPDIRP